MVNSHCAFLITMEKTEKILNQIKRCLIILAPILLIVGCISHIVFYYIKESTKTALIFICSFGICSRIK